MCTYFSGVRFADYAVTKSQFHETVEDIHIPTPCTISGHIVDGRKICDITQIPSQNHIGS
jgi:hypothetical protein